MGNELIQRTLSWIGSQLDARGVLRACELASRDNDSWFGASIDTRGECSHRLFFALKGDHTDGHRFIEEAVAKGSSAIIIQEEDAAKSLRRSKIPFFVVRDTLEALQELSRAYRDTLDVRVIAVTGSAGKTTTREYIRMILKKKYKVHSSPGNFNNHIGVPLTILETDNDNEYLNCEVAANHVGEIEFLSRLLRPDIGVVTNIGDAHIGFFGSREKIAEAKAELFDGVDKGGCAVLPSDDAYLDLLRERSACRVVTFGRAESSTYGISSVVNEGDRIVFDVNGEAMAIKSIGLHNVLNAGAAYAVGELCGVEIDRIRDALIETEPIPGRAKVYRGRGIILIDESYNANPTSMRVALDALSRLSTGRKIAVLGDMAELGAFSDAAHRDLGNYIAGQAVDILYWVGKNGGLVKEGLSGKTLKSFENIDDLLCDLEKEIKPEDVILVKASRACRLDKVVDGLISTVLESGDA